MHGRDNYTYLDFLGIGAEIDVEGPARDLKEYAVVLVRLEDDNAASSSSESASGAARFFPFRSLVGSLIVRDDVEVEGKVVLLALEP